MRITNKIISNNSVTNINRNKVLEDKINTQLYRIKDQPSIR